jgi:hypothetical protein
MSSDSWMASPSDFYEQYWQQVPFSGWKSGFSMPKEMFWVYSNLNPTIPEVSPNHTAT